LYFTASFFSSPTRPPSLFLYLSTPSGLIGDYVISLLVYEILLLKYLVFSSGRGVPGTFLQWASLARSNISTRGSPSGAFGGLRQRPPPASSVAPYHMFLLADVQRFFVSMPGMKAAPGRRC